MSTSHSSLPFAKRQSIGVRMAQALALFLLLVMAANYLVLDTRGRDVLVEQTNKLNDELGQKIILKLRERLAATETLTTSLANLGTVLEKDPDQFMRVVPHVMSQAGMDQLIAGGGIWPEPNTFAEGVERRSFFWGRNAAGVLEYFDDYNDPAGAGYHQEEWYVPARHLKPGQVYWSRSYMDPYSREPMGSCTVPMWAGGKFVGVATIDLKLLGLSEFMRQQAAVTGGYAFAVDRNNRLLSLPLSQKTDDSQVANWVGRQETYPTVAQLAANLQSFSALANHLSEMNNHFIRVIESGAPERLIQLSDLIASQSYQIERTEAMNIAANLLGRYGDNQERARLVLEQDPLLHEAVEVKIFPMADTGWKVLVATPLRYADQVVGKITERMLWLLLILVALASLAFVMFFHSAIIRPIRKLGDQVRASIDDRDYETRLVSDYNDELSQLANWFNARTDQLSEVLTALQARNAELSEARVEAETANRAKNVFLASMSHEIRTPMNAIIGLADVLARTQLDEAQQTYVHTLHGSAQSLLSLVNDIMDFSKIEANKLDLECIAFDLRHTLDDCAELVAFQAHEKKLDFHYFVDPELDQHVMGDPNRLRQVILNLCTNAVKFTASGRVRLWLDKIAQTEELVSLRIIVEDTGIGMSDAARKRLFKPFSQGDSSTTRQYGGTGLGLAISKHLLELMGAELNFDSEEGRGSRFEVRLNLARSRAEHLRQEPLVRHVIAGVSCPVMHEILERYCTHMGCTFEGHADLDAWQRALASHAHKGIALCVRPEWLDHADVVRSAMTASEQERRPVLIMLHSPYDFNASRKLQVSRYFQLVSLGLPLKYEALRSVLLSPQDRMQTHHPVTRQANRELVHLQQKRVLVAEDNHVNQQVIMLLLKDLGLEADIVSDGEQALNAAQNKRYDLILMDWQMPQMDGLQAAREIRKGSADNQPIIVAVTANAMSGDVEACYAAGMNDYLSKPLRRDDLKRVLMQWLG